MPEQPSLTDEEFAQLFETEGPNALAQRLGIAVRSVQQRRVVVEGRLGRRIFAVNTRQHDELRPEAPEIHVLLRDGVVLVGSDGHYWPGVESTAHRAFVHFIRELQPDIVIFNGDALDGASVSRHPPIGWENAPALADELAEVQRRLGELQQAGGKRPRYLWPLGNHDARFNTRLASCTPEFRNVAGTRLTHHFPEWEPCWSAVIGGERGAVVKHRWHGGVHAAHNNALKSGRTLVTGHLHSLKVTPFTDLNGTRWGVDTGCLAAPRGPQFTYQERNPANHCAGFAVLTWRLGELLWPELVSVHDEERGLVNFRGELVSV